MSFPLRHSAFTVLTDCTFQPQLPGAETSVHSPSARVEYHKPPVFLGMFSSQHAQFLGEGDSQLLQGLGQKL
eukprot:CAMPEP_0180433320 /NCGR_PEP_ID=MMETSP1036_2-20121128/9372_1 /TAXON_ID=632150 /ORGANISM="Azadinium spinosum, Strain 3D9" /LENGTH=71 /DNA_ID=CAMNT_0022439145 /DNA_START=214 /DNA_END=429 /DNA_ORIENTATION=-